MTQEKNDREYTLLGASWKESSDLTGAEDALRKLESYSYFDGSAIRQSVEISKTVMRDGERLLQQSKLVMERVSYGYDRISGGNVGQIEAVGKNGKEEFGVKLTFSRTKVTYATCACPKCRRDYYSAWYTNKTNCPYKAAALVLLENYLQEHNLGDATDRTGILLLKAFQEKQTMRLLSDVRTQEESLNLVPRLTRKNGQLLVSFKVGSGKLFVVKKLDEFCQAIRDNATLVYGSNTELNHSISSFTQKGKEWVHFINRIVQEETAFGQRLLQNHDYQAYRRAGIGSALALFGWRLDEFYSHLGETPVEFEDKDAGQKKKQQLCCSVGNPRVTMKISRKRIKNDKEFHGITVNGTLPELYLGGETGYYIDGEKLCRVGKDFLEKIEPLSEISDGDSFSFEVGRNHMAEFYYRVLPGLQEIVDISETEPENFHAYLPPEVQFVFYLDVEDDNAFCRISARYGEEELSVLEAAAWDFRGIEPYRDTGREEEVVYLASKWFPAVDWEKMTMHCDGSEERIYQVMENGVSKLMELGEVQCTKRFLNYRVVKRVRVSVGVSVSSGMLDLKILTQDIPQEELLELLSMYRQKKKYYRMKDGAFVNLEDTSFAMLSELMDTMHLKPKELTKENLRLPMYRTLYLDKLLEENAGVYSRRDSHFREVVKGFKTVKDADFEEPERLSGIMRNYQKEGYKWLRTLEAWNFGGILADDMGLGKTLQVIAVLLAAKQEETANTALQAGREQAAGTELQADQERAAGTELQADRQRAAGTGAQSRRPSLVVCPASLVFNWGEELARFAPELSVLLVTGTQEERRSKIAGSESVDVLVTSYDLLKRDIAEYEGHTFHYEIIDEAQYIKNHTTAAAKAVKVIQSQTRFALTGTPIENRLSELWSIFDYLMPGFLYSYDVFKREMELPIVKNGDEDIMKRLQKMAGPFILRRLKEDVLKDLPEKLEEIRYVRLGDEQQKLYDGQVLHMKEGLAGQSAEEFNKNKIKILAELTRLRQICCDPSLCFENYRGGAAKLEAALELMRSAMDGGHRILLFSQFTSMLEILQKAMDESGIAYYTITGSTPKERRLQLVRDFNEGNTPVFLISLKAGGVGLNLTGADVVIHYDPWWNQAVQNQATDRAHRIGQQKKVTVYKLLVKNSIEEKIQKLQETKKDLAEQVIGGDLSGAAGMSREELLELLEV